MTSIKSPTPSDPHIYNNVDGQPTISNPIAIPPRNMGGRPKGSTKAKKKMMLVKVKHAINWIAMQYDEIKNAADAENKTASKRIRVRDGALEGLITEAKSEFGLNDDFVVHKNTIWNRINTGNLIEVMHPGVQSLLLHLETIFKSYLMTSADLKCPLNVADPIAFANHLLKGSKTAAKIIRRKKERGIYNKDSPLVGHKWYMLFQGQI
jgi:hypothetical protein